MTEKRLIAKPDSSLFGTLATVVDSDVGGGRVLLDTGFTIQRRWLKDPDYPITHPKEWYRLANLGTRDRLIDDLCGAYSREARKSAEEAFGEFSPEARRNVRHVIFDIISSDLDELEDQYEHDYFSTMDEVIGNDD